MKVVHIVGGDITGGAARGAYWLHQALLNIDIESTLIVAGKGPDNDKTVLSLSDSKLAKFYTRLRSKLDGLATEVYKKRKRRLFSTGFIGYDFTKTEMYQKADVVHLHWINGGMVNIKTLAKINKPVIWTIRDMWPLTGGCHYSLDCNKFKSECGACPQLHSNHYRDLSNWVFRHKQENLPANLTVVGISNWLTDLAKSSSTFKNRKCLTILNNIDVNSFSFINKEIARKILGLNTHKQLVLCGASKVDDFYKGFHKFTEALQYLNPEKVCLMFFGELDEIKISKLGFEYRSFGFVKHNEMLNNVYAAADVYAAPSIQEAFGKTLAESQCSGTPVVCFDVTGPQDIVEHKITGYKAYPFDSKDLASGIEWVLTHKNQNTLRQITREKAISKFDSKLIASEYANLYKRVTKSK